MSEYSAGPWHAEGWLVEDAEHRPVALASKGGETGKADARVIAAAPDLYETLAEFRGTHDPNCMCGPCMAAEAALAKVEEK